MTNKFRSKKAIEPFYTSQVTKANTKPLFGKRIWGNELENLRFTIILLPNKKSFFEEDESSDCNIFIILYAIEDNTDLKDFYQGI